MTSLPALFSEHIRQRRESSGLTQAQVAEKAGVNRVTLAKWESGNSGSATIESVEKLLRVLDRPDFFSADLSLAWRDVIRRVGEIDESQVSAVVAGIKAAQAALKLDQDERLGKGHGKLSGPAKRKS